jgi:ribosomal protein L9
VKGSNLLFKIFTETKELPANEMLFKIELLIVTDTSEIKDKVLVVKAKASEKGKLFKSVHGGEVAKAFEAEYHVKMDDSWLPKNFSIKEVGESNVSIEKFGLKVEFILKVEAE